MGCGIGTHKRVLAALVIADADGLVDARQKNLAVADLAGAGGIGDGLDARSTISSGSTTSTFTLGSRSTVYSRPR